MVDGDGAKAVQEQQQRGVHVMEKVSGLMAFRAQREADFSSPADKNKRRKVICTRVLMKSISLIYKKYVKN